MSNRNERVLVTGGAGFIGSHLVEKLVSLGADVTVIDNLSTGNLDNLSGCCHQIKLMIGDLGDLLKQEKVKLDEYECVYHFAANAYIPPSIENPSFDFQMNLVNPFLLLEAMRKTPTPPRLVNISSAAVYGNPVSLPIREIDLTVPISPYGVSKLATERYASVYSQLYGIRATSLRFFSVYGPRQKKQVIYDLFSKLHANPEMIQLFGDGSQARDFNHVQDVVQAVLLAATAAPGQGEVYNVASGKTHTINELAAQISKIVDSKPEIIYSGQVRPGDAEKWEVDITRLQGLGYEPQVSLEEGLLTVLSWFRQLRI